MKKLSTFTIVCAVAFLGAALSASLSARQENRARLMSELAKAPSNAAARANPYDGRPEAFQAGEKLFRRYCAECHTESKGHRRKGPDLLSLEIRSAPPGALAWYLKNGNLGAGMPSWSRLPEQQRWQIVAYLKSRSD